MDPTLADIVRKRIWFRDEIARMKKLHAEELAPAYKACETLDSKMLDYFSREGCKNLATDSGTAYRKISYSVKMIDREAFRDWVINERNWIFADIKPNKKDASEFLERFKEPMPGTYVDGHYTVGYRKIGEEEQSELE